MALHIAKSIVKKLQQQIIKKAMRKYHYGFFILWKSKPSDGRL